jgi:hypothetical protein
MKILIFIISLSTIPAISFSQPTRYFLVGANLDLIKSDHDGYFEKWQGGVEVNYFFLKEFSATAGLEIWTREGASAVVGSRWFPVKDAYIRLRGLIGENDVSIGGGWAKPMTENLRFESMADFYFKGNFSIRAGIAYRVNKRE